MNIDFRKKYESKDGCDSFKIENEINFCEVLFLPEMGLWGWVFSKGAKIVDCNLCLRLNVEGSLETELFFQR